MITYINGNAVSCPSGTAPTAHIFAIQNSCTNGIVDPNTAYLQISEVTDGDAYHYSTGSIFNDNGGANTYSNAINISSATFPLQIVTGLANPTGNQDYTIRLYNGTNQCFTDVVVTLNTQDCALGCNCTDYLYLNDTGLNYVEKWKVNPTNKTISEVGDSQNGMPWLNAAGIVSLPHGIAADENGYLYIGQLDGDNYIRKFNCNGEEIDADVSTAVFDNVIDGLFGYNHFLHDGILYVPGSTNPGLDSYDGSMFPNGRLIAYDVCSGTQLGCLWDAYSWGFAHNSTDNQWYGTVGTIIKTGGLYDPSVYGTNDNCGGFGIGVSNFVDIDTLPNNFAVDFSDYVNPRAMGITFDDVGNMYIAVSDNGGFEAPSSLIKRDFITGIWTQSAIDLSEDANDNDGANWAALRGIVYSPSTGLIYGSSLDDCIAAFDTNLQYDASGSSHLRGDYPKGIGLLTECCPSNNNVTIDTALCAVSPNDTIFLRDLINCGGIICEGMWAEGMSNNGITYNDCNNSITIDALTACGSFTLESNGTNNNSQCGAFTITVNITVNSLDLIISQTSCTDNGNGTFTTNYDAVVNWNSEPCQAGEMINVTHNGTSIGMIDPSTDTSPSTIPFTLSADGNGTNSIKAEFTFASCSDSTSFKTPLPCPADVATCAASANCLGGKAFEDFNCNGTENTSEPGVQGVQVVVYDCENNPVDTVWTDSDGDWQLCGLTDGEAYRVEFILPENIACWASPTHSGSDNGTDVQFLTAPACTKFSLSSPTDYCDSIPRIAVSCFENGDPTGNTNPGLVSFNYSASGLPSNYQGGTGINGIAENPINEATIADIGAVHGTGWQANQQRLFTAALLKRYSGLKDGPGYVYTIDFSTGGAATPVGFNLDGINPSNGGTAINLGTVCRDASCANDVGNTGFASDYELANSPLDQSIDLDAFAKVGTMAFGDADIAEDGNTSVSYTHLTLPTKA